MITKDEIRLIVEQPSQLGPGHDADEYQMEKYKRVAIEAVVEEMTSMAICPEGLEPDGDAEERRQSGAPKHCYYRWDTSDPYDKHYEFDCRRCWREWLEGQ